MSRLLVVLALSLAALFAVPALAAVNINTATKDELIALPGIGPAKAQAILDHRKAHGPFKSVEELKDVKGIGAKRFEKLKPELAVSGPSLVKAAMKPEEKGAGSAQRSARGDMAAASGAAKRDTSTGAIKP